MTQARLFCPYKGLQPYTEKDRDYFFGREEDQETIAANLVTAPLTILYGASGVGKTSVLQAGVVPFLQQLPDVTVVVFKAWQDRTFLSALKGEIARAVTERTGQSFSADDAPLDEFLAQATGTTRSTFTLILDQFEEYFLYHPEGESGNHFDAEFARVVNRDEIDANFLLSIREDSLSRLDRFQGRIPNLFDNYLRIEHLDREVARAAIEKPTEQYNRLYAAEGQQVSIEPKLVEAVLKDPALLAGQAVLGKVGRGVVRADTSPTLAKERIEVSYLQLVMTRLWEEEMGAGSRTLRLGTLNRLGGAEQIVKRHLDAALGGLPLKEQEAAARVFHHLVTPSGTKIAHAVPDLAEYAELAEMQVKPVLDKLSGPDIRILCPVPGGRYEIFHDMLAPAILDWRRRYVEQQVQEQIRREEQERWEREQADAARQRELERARLWRWGAIGLSLLLILMVALAFFAFQQRNRAEQQGRLATSRQLAAQALTHLDKKLDLALLLSLEASRIADTIEARGSLLAGLEFSPHLTAFLHDHTKEVWSVAFSPGGQMLASGSADKTIILWDVATRQPLGQPLTGHKASVLSVAFSPDGRMLASGSADKTIILWDVATHQPLGQPLTGHTAEVRSVAFSSDGQVLASGSADGTIILWDVETRQPLGQPLTGHNAPVLSVTFSPDGQTLASGSADNTIILWNVEARQPLGQPLTGHNAPVLSVAFSPDGQTLASGSADSTIILWDVAARQPLGQPLTGHEAPVWSVAFSPDGQTLASGSEDNTIILWDVAARQPLGEPLIGHTDQVLSIVFSPYGQMLASGSWDKTIILWDVEARQSLGPSPTGHTDAVSSVAFSPDGQTLASGSRDKTIILWDVAARQSLGQPLTGHTDQVLSVVFSPDGQTLASGSCGKLEDGTKRCNQGEIRLWDVATRQPLGQLFIGHTDWVNSVAFSPDGQTLASGSADKTIILWDVEARQPLGQPLTSHKAPVLSVAFSPNGQTLASGSGDKTIILWDVEAHQSLGQPLTGHSAPVWSVAFSSDGRTLASGSEDNTIILWDVEARQPLGQPLTGHKAPVLSVAFSPDSQTLASGSRDNTIILWDVEARQSLGQPLIGHEAPVLSVAFSPDGQTLASGSADKTIILRDVSFESWQARACRIANRNLKQDEWEQFLGPDIPYERTCPDLPPGEGAPPAANPGIARIEVYVNGGWLNLAQLPSLTDGEGVVLEVVVFDTNGKRYTSDDLVCTWSVAPLGDEDENINTDLCKTLYVPSRDYSVQVVSFKVEGLVQQFEPSDTISMEFDIVQ